jgi:hypothetical protein
MAFAAETTYFDRGDGSILGSFTEKEYGKHFEFSENNENFQVLDPKNEEYPHKVWVTTPWKMDSGWRFAKVLKTRAYVLTNDADGNNVVEKWYHTKYTEYRPV